MCHERFKWHGRIPHIWACTTTTPGQPPYLFDKGFMRKTNKSVLATHLCNRPLSRRLQHCLWWLQWREHKSFWRTATANTTNICWHSVWKKYVHKNNKARLTEFISKDLQSKQFTAKQHVADADTLLVSTALSMEDERKQPVAVVANNTDILVMRVCLSRSNGNIHLLHSHSPIQLINVQGIWSANACVSEHILFLHIMTGCDTHICLIYEREN